MQSSKIAFLIVICLSLGACSFTKKIKDGTMAFELKQYSIAATMLNDEYQTANDQRSKARLAYLLGESYWSMGDVEQALPWYSKAVDNEFGPKALEKKAYSLKHVEKYSQAIKVFEILLRESPQSQKYRGEIAICTLADLWVKADYKPYEIDRAFFNSRQSDYAPAFRDNQHVFFSSDRSGSTADQTYQWTGRSYSDIYMYNVRTAEVSHFDPAINSEHNEGTLCFTGDGSTVFFTRCIANEEYDDYCKIMSSDFVEGNWTKPRILPFVKDGVNYGHPFWSEAQNVLFFSSEQQKGFGGFDIYYSQRDSNLVWSTPVVLPEIINSLGDEKFPTVKDDTLFFSSDGHYGMGGLDIFYSYINSNGQWERPTNMKSPINSGYDDFGLIFEPYGDGFLDQGYFSSSRNGFDDVYKFAHNEREEQELEVVIGNPTGGAKSLKLAITVIVEDESGEKRPAPKAKVLVNGKAVKLNSKGFSFRDIREQAYEIEVSKAGYFSMSERIEAKLDDVPNDDDSYTYNKTIVLKPIVENKEIVLENILYDFNESFIREDAKPSLNELATILRSNPSIIIELSSHTDCRGPNAYNQKLSQERAESAVDYILNLGIDGSRISARGYGESQPKADCVCDSCDEDGHQVNRRTAFKIVGTK